MTCHDLKKRRGVLWLPTVLPATILLSFLSACSSAPPPLKKPVVLADTTGLSLEQESADLLLYRRPGVAKLNHYTAFIIEPVEVVYTSRGMMAVSQDEITEIKRYFQRAVISELREHGYQVVHKPAERVLRVQLKLTGLDPGRPLLNLTGTTASAVTMEAEFRESLSDRLDAVVVSRRLGNTQGSEAATLGKVESVEPALDAWAVKFRRAVDRAQGRG